MTGEHLLNVHYKLAKRTQRVLILDLQGLSIWGEDTKQSHFLDCQVWISLYLLIIYKQFSGCLEGTRFWVRNKGLHYSQQSKHQQTLGNPLLFQQEASQSVCPRGIPFLISQATSCINKHAKWGPAVSTHPARHIGTQEAHVRLSLSTEAESQMINRSDSTTKVWRSEVIKTFITQTD